MQIIWSGLKLVRWVNLLIIALSMYMFQYFVVRFYLDAADSFATLSPFYFGLLVLATVLIAAAGNVVNGYFDFEQDMEYKPEKVVVGKDISQDAAFNLQLWLNVIGVLIGFFLSYHFQHIRLGYLFLTSATLLWVYSQLLKKYFLIGNVTIAGLSAFVFMMPVLFESKLYSPINGEMEARAMSIIVTQMKWYALFAFLVSLMREIAKDAEDRDADEAYGYTTLAVSLPMWAVNTVLVLLMLATMAVIGYIQIYFYHQGLLKHMWYAMFFLQFPLLIDVISTIASRTKMDYHNLSVQIKLLMFFGIASLSVYWYLIKSA